MSIASQADWDGIRRAGRIVRRVLDALERHTRPGVSTAELDEIAARVLAAAGARSAPSLVYGFPGHVLISVNDEVVHGVPGARRLRTGDLVKLDVTVEKDGYMADAARSVALPDASAMARDLAAAAEAAFVSALTAARVGRLVREVGAAVEDEVSRWGFSVIRPLGGHGIGRTIHEPPSVPNFCDRRQRDALTDGLVITIEPIITAGSGRVFGGSDGWTIRTADRALAAHHEETIVITGAGPVLMTAA